MSLYRRFLLLALMSAHRSGLGYYLPNAIQKKAAPYPMEGVVGSGVFRAALSSYGSGAAYSVPHIVLAAQRLNQRNRVESFPV